MIDGLRQLWLTAHARISSVWSQRGGVGPRAVGHTRTVIRCEEYGVESDEVASGWRGYVTPDLDDEEQEKQVLFFCPDCARREFGSFDGLWE
jgi:hypothetical protein